MLKMAISRWHVAGPTDWVEEFMHHELAGTDQIIEVKLPRSFTNLVLTWTLIELSDHGHKGHPMKGTQVSGFSGETVHVNLGLFNWPSKQRVLAPTAEETEAVVKGLTLISEEWRHEDNRPRYNSIPPFNPDLVQVEVTRGPSYAAERGLTRTDLFADGAEVPMPMMREATELYARYRDNGVELGCTYHVSELTLDASVVNPSDMMVDIVRMMGRELEKKWNERYGVQVPDPTVFDKALTKMSLEYLTSREPIIPDAELTLAELHRKIAEIKAISPNPSTTKLRMAELLKTIDKDDPIFNPKYWSGE